MKMLSKIVTFIEKKFADFYCAENSIKYFSANGNKCNIYYVHDIMFISYATHSVGFMVLLISFKRFSLV